MTRLTVFLLAGFVFALDRATKLWSVHRLGLDVPGITLVRGILYFARTSNTGSAFGLFSHSTAVLAAASLAAALAISYYVARQRHAMPLLLGAALALPLGGALGNFYDRARHGSVVDFILVQLGSYSWPVFNVADSAICIGVALLAWYSLRAASTTSNAEETVAAPTADIAAVSEP